MNPRKEKIKKEKKKHQIWCRSFYGGNFQCNCTHSKNFKGKNSYKKYWKVTLKNMGEGDRVFNRVESLDDFFKHTPRNIDFEIERLSKKEFEETER